MSKIRYSTEPFKAHPDALAAKLTTFGVKVKRYAHFLGCCIYRDEDGDYVKEIGELWRDLEGDDAGRTIVRPRSDAAEAERIVLLRSAEVAHRCGYDFAGWNENTPNDGVKFLSTVILVVFDHGEADHFLEAFARVPQDCWDRRDATFVAAHATISET